MQGRCHPYPEHEATDHRLLATHKQDAIDENAENMADEDADPACVTRIRSRPSALLRATASRYLPSHLPIYSTHLPM